MLKQRGRKIPSAKSAAATLYDRAKDYYEKNRPLKTDSEGFVSFWQWNAKEKNVEYNRMPLSDAYKHFARHYAKQAWQIDSDPPQIRKLYLATSLDKGNVAEVTNLAKIDLLEQVLAESMLDGHDVAAQSAATLLGTKGGAGELLASQDGRVRVLVQATMAKNRRVRFAALETVMALKPQTPFPGSSFVAETLTWFAKADGQRILVSAHPKSGEAAQLAGYFGTQGYRGELATNGREAMRQAAFRSL